MLAAQSSRSCAKGSRRDVQMVSASYVTFAASATVVYYVLSDGLSSLLTLSAGLQALAFILLVLKVNGQSSVSGLSTSMLGMYTATLILRLSSTLCVDGYLPADSTGDWMFQCLELLSLGLAAFLLKHVSSLRKSSFGGDTQDAQDSMPGLPFIVVACVCCALFYHADLNRNVIYDRIWASACYIETAAMLPQLWMMAKAGGEVEALTSHFIALTTAARFCSLSFWYLAFESGISFDEAGNHSEMVIIGAHLIQLLLACDFLMVYVKSFGKRVTIGEVTAQWI